MSRIYVASSWRNSYQPDVVIALRAAGHTVYDFRNPADGEDGFSWDQVDLNWRTWSVDEFLSGLEHPIARHAFERDRSALERCEVCVLVLPCGMSAHLEAGWCAGSARRVLIYAPEMRQAELMYGLLGIGGRTHIYSTLHALLASPVLNG